MSLAKSFTAYDVDFCPSCGTLLPTLPLRGNVHCLACKMEIPIDTFKDVERSYSVAFHSRDDFERARKKRKNQGDGDSVEVDDEDAEGMPTVDRKCPKCGHEKMSYAALQLRSADEGQTVFFTCVKCKFKESENS